MFLKALIYFEEANPETKRCNSKRELNNPGETTETKQP
jgi:hypothetical protein